MTRLLLLLVFFSAPALAAPDLGTFKDLEGVRVYRDHKQRNLWYLSPAMPRIATRENGLPDYALDEYRYHGRSGTGDREQFWARGILSVGISRDRDPGMTNAIRKVLRTSGVSAPRLRSMPVTGAEVRLMYADQGQSWQQATRWSGRQLVLPLEPMMAQALWKSVEKDHTLVSLVVDEQMSGLRRKDSRWEEAQTSMTWTIQIDLDMKKYPELFRKTSLGGRMSHGYTGVEVFCFDFLEGLVPELYAKIVRLAIPTTGRDLVEEVTFREDSAYRYRVDFKHIKNLDQPYRVQVVRVYKDGRRETGPWLAKTGESKLDVTAYREPEEESGADKKTLLVE